MRENDLSLEISMVLLLAYAAHLVFSLGTHKQLFAGIPAEAFTAAWSMKRSILVGLPLGMPHFAAYPKIINSVRDWNNRTQSE
jgi:Ca2+/H+ antiporter